MNKLLIISIINNIFKFYSFLIFIRVFLSWFQVSFQNDYFLLLYNITEPILRPIRELTLSFNIGIDISPMVALFFLNFMRSFIIKFLVSL